MGRGNQKDPGRYRGRQLRSLSGLHGPVGGRLTLGATVGEASGRNGLSNNGRDVDDASSLLLDSRSERTVVGVLGVDSIGDASVDNEGTKGVNVQEFLHDLHIVSDASTSEVEREIHRNTVLQLVVPLTSRCNGRTVNATKELDTLGKRFESSLTSGIDLPGVDNVGFEIESLLSVIALDLGGAGLLIQHVEDLNHRSAYTSKQSGKFIHHNHSAPSNDVARDRTTNGTGTTGNNVSCTSLADLDRHRGARKRTSA